MTLRHGLSAACVIVAVLAIQLWIFLPVAPRGALGWVLLIALGLPVSLLIEWLGDVALRPAFIRRLSSPMRVLVALPVVLVLGTLACAMIWGVRLAVSLA